MDSGYGGDGNAQGGRHENNSHGFFCMDRDEMMRSGCGQKERGKACKKNAENTYEIFLGSLAPSALETDW